MALTKTEFIKWAESKGWQKDRFGHYQKSMQGKDYRFKVSKVAVRYEVKVNHKASEYSNSSNEWMRVRSGYFKDLSITTEGKLLGTKKA